MSLNIMRERVIALYSRLVSAKQCREFENNSEVGIRWMINIIFETVLHI